jgi:hypothetical protein
MKAQMKIHVFNLDGDEKPWVVVIKSEEWPNPVFGNQILIPFKTAKSARRFVDRFKEIVRDES